MAKQTDKPKEKKTLSSLFAKREEGSTPSSEKKTLSSLFTKKEEGSTPLF